jgi:hypothetical protein
MKTEMITTTRNGLTFKKEQKVEVTTEIKWYDAIGGDSE